MDSRLGVSMKKQSPAYGYGYAHPPDITTTTARPSTRGSNASSNLPSIFDNIPGGLLLHRRPPSGLQLDVKGLPTNNTDPAAAGGLPFSISSQRERDVPGGKRLSSSDTSADRIRQAHSRLQRGSNGGPGEGYLSQRRYSQPAVPVIQNHPAKARVDRNKLLLGPTARPGDTPPVLSPSSPMRPGGAAMNPIKYGALPPIGSETTTPGEIDAGEDDSIHEDDEGESTFDSSERRGGHGDDESYSDSESTDDEEILETGSEAPPSGPGFESDAEKSAEMFQIPFPDVNVSFPFPATMIQHQMELDTERFEANTTSTGLSPRVNNIVRGFLIHGPVDKDLLSQALNGVAKLHPLLFATFQRARGKLYGKTNTHNELPPAMVHLEVPLMGHEQAEDLLLNARRKIFHIEMDSDMTPLLTPSHGGGGDVGVDERGVEHCLSLASIGDLEGEVVKEEGDSPTTATAVAAVVPSNQQTGRKRIVSFAGMETPSSPVIPARTIAAKSENRFGIGGEQLARHTQLLPALNSPSKSLQPMLPPPEEKEKAPLIRARLVSKSTSKHFLVVSFPRILCDFWSSCLFMQQLTDLYGKLERSNSYRPSLAAMKAESKRQGVMQAYEKERKKHNVVGGRKLDAATRLMQRRAPQQPVLSKESFVPMIQAKLDFQQVAQREKQLLMMLPRERLLAFWEAVLTATIKRERGGGSRVKVVPPVRIPSGLGEVVVGGNLGGGGRPQTSRLRPLTASRNRPITARRQQGGGGGGVGGGGKSSFGDTGISREALLGPKTKFHFIKIDDEVGEHFKLHLPESCQSSIPRDDQLKLLTLGAYVLLLGKCCRGWGVEHRHTSRSIKSSIGSRLRDGSARYSGSTMYERSSRQVYAADPLQMYKTQDGCVPKRDVAPVVLTCDHSPQLRGQRRGARLDVGSFLIGVEVSLRDYEPVMTRGLFGPLTNDAGIRVNLSSSETFADLLVALSKSLQLANKHGHLPFRQVADEVGLINDFPVRFSFLRHSDVVQLANPNSFFYVETAVGVVDQGLGRLGNNCYLTPLNSKMDDSCHLELVLWESYDQNDSLAGGFCYQPHVLRQELAEALGEEFGRLLKLVASNPSAPLLDVARQIRPPFLNARKTKDRGKQGKL